MQPIDPTEGTEDGDSGDDGQRFPRPTPSPFQLVQASANLLPDVHRSLMGSHMGAQFGAQILEELQAALARRAFRNVLAEARGPGGIELIIEKCLKILVTLGAFHACALPWRASSA